LASVREDADWGRIDVIGRHVMNRMTVRITQQDGCVLEVTMPTADYERLHERWMDIVLHDGDDSIDLPSPGGEIVSVPASEIRHLEPVS
jgi:hypothetical protein